MPMVEFVWWPGTDAFLADFEKIINPTVTHISSTKGCLRISYGLEVEDRTKFWMISHAHHQAMMDSPDYAVMVGRLKPYFGGELKMNHVEFVDDERPSFSAPVTAISFLRIRENAKSKEPEANEGLQALMKGNSSGIGGTWGQTQEEDALKIVIVGWKTVESHWNPPILADADLEIIHVKFKEVFGS